MTARPAMAAILFLLDRSGRLGRSGRFGRPPGLLFRLDSSLLGGVEAELENGGYSLIATMQTRNDPVRETALYENFIKGGWVDALLIVRTRVNDTFIFSFFQPGKIRLPQVVESFYKLGPQAVVTMRVV